jgi:hypothetical protein
MGYGVWGGGNGVEERGDVQFAYGSTTHASLSILRLPLYFSLCPSPSLVPSPPSSLSLSHTHTHTLTHTHTHTHTHTQAFKRRTTYANLRGDRTVPFDTAYFPDYREGLKGQVSHASDAHVSPYFIPHFSATDQGTTKPQTPNSKLQSPIPEPQNPKPQTLNPDFGFGVWSSDPPPKSHGTQGPEPESLDHETTNIAPETAIPTPYALHPTLFALRKSHERGLGTCVCTLKPYILHPTSYTLTPKLNARVTNAAWALE